MIRYQEVDIYIPATSSAGTYRKSIDLYAGLLSCTGIAILPLSDVMQENVKMSIKDNVGFLMHETPLVFFIDRYRKEKTPFNIPTNFFPKVFKANDNRIDIELSYPKLNNDLYLTIVFMLEDKDYGESDRAEYSKFRYFSKQFELPALDASNSTYKANLFQLPSEYKYVTGLWIVLRDSSDGEIQNPAPLKIEIRDESGVLLLDKVLIDFLFRRPIRSNLNTMFYPINILSGRNVSIEFTILDNAVLKSETAVDVVFLLSDRLNHLYSKHHLK